MYKYIKKPNEFQINRTQNEEIRIYAYIYVYLHIFVFMRASELLYDTFGNAIITFEIRIKGY